MRLNKLLVACLLIGGMSAVSSAAAERGQLTALDLTIDETSTSQIALSWTEPTSSTGFLRYEVNRADAVARSIVADSPEWMAVALLCLFGAGLVFRRRRSVLVRVAAVAVCGSLGGITVWAGMQLDFETIATITEFDQTSLIDDGVEAGGEYFYQVDAMFAQSTQSSDIEFARAEAATQLPSDAELNVRFEIGTPGDGVIVSEAQHTATVTVSAPASVRGVDAGELRLNGTLLESGINGTVEVPFTLDEGPNFLELTGTIGDKTVVVARTLSLADVGVGGQLISKAFGLLVSPAVATGDTLIDKFVDEFNAQTPADWNDLFGQLTYPIPVCAPPNDPKNPPSNPNDCDFGSNPDAPFKVDISFTDIELDSDGDLTIGAFGLGGVQNSAVVLDADVLIDGLDLHYDDDFTGEFDLGAFRGTICSDEGLNRIRFGRVRVQVRTSIYVSTDCSTGARGDGDKLCLDVAALQGEDILDDEAAGTSDEFDTDWKITIGQFCDLLGGDGDALLISAINDQIDTIFPVELSDVSFENELNSGVTVQLDVVELRQNPDDEGVVIRFDAAVNNDDASFPFTDNPPAEGESNNSLFPDNIPPPLGSAFNISDDVINQSFAAGFATGQFTGTIEDELMVGDESVALTVAGLDPGTPDGLMPGLRDFAALAAPAQIQVTFTKPPVVGLRDIPARAQGGFRLLVTGFQAEVFVDVFPEDQFPNPLLDSALIMDFDVLATTDVELEEGAVKFVVERPVEGYSVLGGFLDLPHVSAEAIAGAIIEDRFTRILDILDGVGGSGIVIPGLEFETIDAAADGDSTGPYRDSFTSWGSTNIDLKELLEGLIELLNSVGEEP